MGPVPVAGSGPLGGLRLLTARYGELSVWVTASPDEVALAPSPKVQTRDVIEPVEPSTKVTVSGAVPVVGLARGEIDRMRTGLEYATVPMTGSRGNAADVLPKRRAFGQNGRVPDGCVTPGHVNPTPPAGRSS